MRSRHEFVAMITVLLLFASAGCSKRTSERSPNTPAGGYTNTSAGNSNTGPSSTSEGTPTTWEANAASLNGTVGQTFTLACSPGGTERAVWGSDIYTADSSICTAGVHSGLITFEQGGPVTIELRPGRTIYGCSERNGVTTHPYGRFSKSFVFKSENIEALLREAEDETPVLWSTPASMVTFEVGKTLKFKCPAGGQDSAVWGTDIYTADSSICNAAVHAGKLKIDDGGSVTIELRPGESAYKGTTRNGIKTNDYGNYGSSFIVK